MPWQTKRNEIKVKGSLRDDVCIKINLGRIERDTRKMYLKYSDALEHSESWYVIYSY